MFARKKRPFNGELCQRLEVNTFGAIMQLSSPREWGRRPSVLFALLLAVLAGCASPQKTVVHAPPPTYKPPVPQPKKTPPQPRVKETLPKPKPKKEVSKPKPKRYQSGVASWYGRRFHGRRTANGERYNMNAMTAAHRKLPFGTWVRVERLDNGRQVVVRINDRGPFIKGRVIDLSRAAARRLGILGAGVASVRIIPLQKGAGRKSKSKRVTRYIKSSPADRSSPSKRVGQSDRKTRWYVYVGKFRKREIASRFANRMRKGHLATRVVPSWHQVPKYFHVHIKGFPRKKRAVDLVARLKREGYNAYIVKGHD